MATPTKTATKTSRPATPPTLAEFLARTPANDAEDRRASFAAMATLIDAAHEMAVMAEGVAGPCRYADPTAWLAFSIDTELIRQAVAVLDLIRERVNSHEGGPSIPTGDAFATVGQRLRAAATVADRLYELCGCCDDIRETFGLDPATTDTVFPHLAEDRAAGRKKKVVPASHPTPPAGFTLPLLGVIDVDAPPAGKKAAKEKAKPVKRRKTAPTGVTHPRFDFSKLPPRVEAGC